MARRDTEPTPLPEPTPQPEPAPQPDPGPDATASTGITRPAPTDPSFGLSAGEAADLEVRGVTGSPFTGEQRLASDHGITPATQEAQDNEDRARAGGRRLDAANAAAPAGE